MCGAVIRRPVVQRQYLNPTGDGALGSAPAASCAPQASDTDLQDALRRISIENVDCGYCRVTNAIDCGIEGFTCGKCGQTSWVHLSAASARFHKRAEQHVETAQRYVTTILADHADCCRRLWESLQEELALEEALWTSQDKPVLPGAAHSWALAREGFAQGNFERISIALADLEKQGLLKSSASFEDSLQKLRRAEEIETAWRCIQQALHDHDRSDLEFWQQEVLSHGAEPPSDILLALRALESAELSRLTQWEYQKQLQERVDAAFQARDEDELVALAREAAERGGDPASAEAAHMSLQTDRACGTSPEEDVLNALRCQSQSSLKAQLAEAGIIPDGIFEKEELVQLLYVTRLKAPTTTANGSMPEQRGAAQPRHRSPLRVNSDTVGSASAHGVPPASAASPSARSPAAGESGRYSAHRTSPSKAAEPSRAASPAAAQASSGSSGAKTAKPSPKASGPRKPLIATSGKMTRGKALLCLGLDDTASASEIRQAYKKAALRWHPDRRQNHDNEDEAKARFQEAKEAFDYLSKRAR